MRVDDRMRKCVMFVGVETHGRFTPLGTGFLCGVQIESFTLQVLATADHVVDQVRGDYFWVRANRNDGRAATVRVEKRHVIRHDNLINDIALAPVMMAPDVFDFMLFPLSRDQIEAPRKTIWNPGLGDEVCAIGLYTSHHGLTKNIPVVRTGNLAALCEEPVIGPKGGYVDAYLIDLRTIAGLSGSPVFVNIPQIRVEGDQLKIRQGKDQYPLPIGMLIGYHVVETKEDQIQVPRFGGQRPAAGDPEKGPPSPDERNTGFGVVIPIERALEIVEREDVRANMAKAVESGKRAKGP